MRISASSIRDFSEKFKRKGYVILFLSFVVCSLAFGADKPFILPDASTPKGNTQPVPETRIPAQPPFVNTPTAAASTVDALTNLPLRVLASGVFQLGKVTMDKNLRTVSFPAVLNMREGPMEYFLVTDYGKKHESVLRTDVEPYHIHIAMLFLNAKGGANMPKPETIPPPGSASGNFKNEPLSHPSADRIPGDRVSLEMKWTQDGKEIRRKTEDLIASTDPKAKPGKIQWYYTGSRVVNRVFLAQLLGNIGSLVTDPDALLNNEGPGHDNDHIWTSRPANLPPVGTPVEVTIRFTDKEKN